MANTITRLIGQTTEEPPVKVEVVKSPGASGPVLVKLKSGELTPPVSFMIVMPPWQASAGGANINTPAMQVFKTKTPRIRPWTQAYSFLLLLMFKKSTE